jgi:hypothetical protein
MTFFARLKRGAIWQLWHNQNRVSGIVDSVVFRWQRNGDYVTADLGPGDMERLRSHPEVALESVEVAPVNPVSKPQAPVNHQAPLPVNHQAPSFKPLDRPKLTLNKKQ